MYEHELAFVREIVDIEVAFGVAGCLFLLERLQLAVGRRGVLQDELRDEELRVVLVDRDGRRLNVPDEQRVKFDCC